MRYKTNRIISFLLVMVLAFNFAGCTGKAKELSGEPSDVMDKLQSSIQKFDQESILKLTMEEKGSSSYKEYQDILNIDAYDDDIAKCYRAVAGKTSLKYSSAEIDKGEGIAKVHLTVICPEWKKVFSDTSFKNADEVVAAVGNAPLEETSLTLRLIDTKDGLKIKNFEDLMDIFDFVGWDIASAPSWGSDTPAGTNPSETEPSETEPDKTEPSSKKPTKAPSQGSKDDLAAAYAAYKKVLSENKDVIAWYEKNILSNSCGLFDLNNDGIPDLIFFCKSADDKFIDVNIYSYLPENKAVKRVLSASLVEYDSKVSEFFVIRDSSGNIVVYKGFIDEKNVISYYNNYEYNGFSGMLIYSGFMISGVVNGETEKAVCTVRGFDKYDSNASIDYNEFLRIEKDLLTKADIVFCSRFLPSSKSTAAEHLSKRSSFCQTYAEVLKQLG